MGSETEAMREELAAVRRGLRWICDSLAHHESFPGICGAIDCYLLDGKIPKSWASPEGGHGG